MVTTKEGILTTQGVGSGSTQANRVLVDYKDALQDYRVTALPVVEMFAENFTTETVPFMATERPLPIVFPNSAILSLFVSTVS